MLAALIATGVVGWILAAGFAALWWGERGRRLDLAHIKQVQLRSDKPAEIVRQDPDAESEAIRILHEEEREEMIRAIVKEGHNRRDAEAEVDRIISTVRRRGFEG